MGSAGTETGRALANLLKESERLDEIQRRAERVNILEVFRITRQELAHSAFWAWLWKPGASHRMGDRFLRAFLRHCTSPRADDEKRAAPWRTPELLDVEAADLSQAEVTVEMRPEWMADKGKEGAKIAGREFDVGIVVPIGDGKAGGEEVGTEKLLVVAEFKIKAREGEMQTPDYRAAVEAAATGKDPKFASALAVFVDFNGREPEDSAFVPISLQDLVGVVIDPILNSCRDVMPAGVASLLEQYRLAVNEEYEEDGKDLREFCERHAAALASLRDYRGWKPQLSDLIRRGDLPDGSTIVFRDTQDTEEVHGTIRLRDGRPEIMVRKEGREIGPFPKPSTAARGAGRATRNYSGWDVWRYRGQTLADLRDRAVRSEGQIDQYCKAILNGRSLAVECLLRLAGNEVIPAVTAPGGVASRGGTLLSDLVVKGLLEEGQVLAFRKDVGRSCTVQMRGDQAVLSVGGKDFTTPSGASSFLNKGRTSSGFVDLWYQDGAGQWHRLEDLRDLYRHQYQPQGPEADEGE